MHLQKWNFLHVSYSDMRNSPTMTLLPIPYIQDLTKYVDPPSMLKKVI